MSAEQVHRRQVETYEPAGDPWEPQEEPAGGLVGVALWLAFCVLLGLLVGLVFGLSWPRALALAALTPVASFLFALGVSLLGRPGV